MQLPFADDRQRQEKLVEHLVRAGYPRCEPPMLQPAAAFFESGEDMRGRLFLTHDIAGTEMCLRPGVHDPVCRHYIASADFGHPAAIRIAVRCSGCAATGRASSSRPASRISASPTARRRMPRSSPCRWRRLRSSRRCGSRRRSAMPGCSSTSSMRSPSRRNGAAGSSAAWPRARDWPASSIPRATAASTIPASSPPWRASTRRARARWSRTCWRSPASPPSAAAPRARSRIASSSRRRSRAAPAYRRGTAGDGALLAVGGDPDQASTALRALLDEAKLPLGPALDRFDHRLGFLAARGLDIAALRFSARLIRNLDYYTGFVFEARDAARPSDAPIVGGGRYDRLATTLGASAPVPAVGVSLWADRRTAEGLA